MNILKAKFNPNDSNSVSNRFRRKRFRYFKELIKDLPKPVKILDVGGTQSFWELMGFTSPAEASITILNNENISITLPNFKFVQGNAADMRMFRDSEFDVVFSNSVIEHLGNIENQRKMAREIIRTGKKYFVQTPNYYFPSSNSFLIK
jgi:ubiquinone/menaquinone biosynthesis C-methylase UbiE